MRCDGCVTKSRQRGPAAAAELPAIVTSASRACHTDLLYCVAMQPPLPRPLPARSALPASLAALLSLTAWVGAVPAEAAGQGATPVAEPTFYIREYRVSGVRQLTPAEIGEAVYPFLGPGRTGGDVEQARAVLEKAYRDKGFQTVNVQVPAQQGRGGIVYLEAVENKVGRLRVKGSRYFSLADIRRRAPSLAEGKVPNFNEVTRDIVALNGLPDRRVTPVLRAGVEPGTVDIDLNVKDTFPLHGSIELNNRYSANTTELRLNGSLSYNNLWQLGHSLGLSFQIAPERLDDALVFSGYYLMRFADVPWLSFMVSGTKQDSNVSTLGGVAVAGRGEIIGARAIVTLPTAKDFYHSLSFGLDYKHFEENVLLGLTETQTPITYYPISLTYNASWAAKGRLTDLNAGVVFHIRGTGSEQEEFDAKRFRADGSFFYFRGDLSHTQDLPAGFQLYGKVQGQASGQPLLNSEQFSGGGLSTARGYRESEAVGDSALFGTLELHSPSLSTLIGDKLINEWRVYLFGDAGLLRLNQALPEQDSRFEMASYGVGSRVKVLQHLNGSIDAGFPLISAGQTLADDLLITFRVWGEF